MKKGIKIAGIILLAIVLIPVAYIVFLRIIMYDPEPVESADFISGRETVSTGDSLSVLTFNIGYAGYNKNEDFFMDGGKGVQPSSVDDVMKNISGISSIISGEDCDIVFTQEVDIDSRRSYHINEDSYIRTQTGYGRSFACNYNVVFVPYPIPPIGKVYSGIATYTDLNVSEAQRISLPDAAPWYIEMGYLKRCLLLNRIPLDDSDKELVLINLHMEAYTDEEKRDLQVKQLSDLLAEEHEKGNYVIAGGDFNEEFSVNDNPPIISQTGWIPGEITLDDIPEGFRLAVADNIPSCRSLEKPFADYESSQTYIIDGFIVSDNISVQNVEVRDYGFECSDHNPVKMNLTLLK